MSAIILLSFSWCLLLETGSGVRVPCQPVPARDVLLYAGMETLVAFPSRKSCARGKRRGVRARWAAWRGKGRAVAQFLSTWWKSFAIYQACNGIGGAGRLTPSLPGRVRFALLLSPLPIQSEAFLCAAVPRLSNEVRAEGANGSQIARGDLGSRTSVGYSL